jgi:hypothetical protein
MNSLVIALLSGQTTNERADKTFDSILVVLKLFSYFSSYLIHIHMAVVRTTVGRRGGRERRGGCEGGRNGPNNVCAYE